MEKILITEKQVKKILDALLSEEVKKVSRQDFNRTQFKIEELQNSLNEAMSDFRKLYTTLPSGLDSVAKPTLVSIARNLEMTRRNINKLKDDVTVYKKTAYGQSASKVTPPAKDPH